MTGTSGAHTPALTAAIGGAGGELDADEVRSFIAGCLAGSALDGRSVCVLVPDATRTCPLPLLVESVHAALHERVSALTFLVALGTHQAMGEGALAAHLGRPAGARVIEHEWWKPSTFVDVGTIPAARVRRISEGVLDQPVAVRVNRAVVEHDVILIVGPVFPHEVVGFSGGNKYLFPGVSGPELIDVSHWLGALITSAGIIGRRGTTPVRSLIDQAAAMLPVHRLALCTVMAPAGGGLSFMAFGAPEEAWAAAADVAALTHVRYLDAPVRRVLSVLATRYDDMWTGAKGFYKVEPVVADGGEVVILAPHICELAPTHPAVAEIGYHCRDYFVSQWDRFRDYHWTDLAHSTHLAGAGTYDALSGERRRVKVTLATGIGEDVVRSVGLGYLAPERVDVAGWRADPDTLVVDDAGEDLFRLR